ncbi:VOC family protein [Burkholderia diffusa]|uniref:VOC family protein n=1 Tax=Burkholderia diffusa TaxID=488732 RepID=UPI0009BDF0E8|nr:VOC family protein [Burkholderia diffusa]
MIDPHDIRYVRLGTRNLVSAEKYALEILALELVRNEAGAHYFRSDDRDHTRVYFEGDPRDHVVGFELRTADELDAATSQPSNAGVDVKAGTLEQCEQRHVGVFSNCRDLSGNSVVLVVQPYHSGRRYFPSRDEGITRSSHVGLCTTNAERNEKFWTETLGARVSDRIGDAQLLRIDEIHHKVA